MIASIENLVAAEAAVGLSEARKLAQIVEVIEPGGKIASHIASILGAWVDVAEQILSPQAVAA